MSRTVQWLIVLLLAVVAMSSGVSGWDAWRRVTREQRIERAAKRDQEIAILSRQKDEGVIKWRSLERLAELEKQRDDQRP